MKKFLWVYLFCSLLCFRTDQANAQTSNLDASDDTSALSVSTGSTTLTSTDNYSESQDSSNTNEQAVTSETTNDDDSQQSSTSAAASFASLTISSVPTDETSSEHSSPASDNTESDATILSVASSSSSESTSVTSSGQSSSSANDSTKSNVKTSPVTSSATSDSISSSEQSSSSTNDITDSTSSETTTTLAPTTPFHIKYRTSFTWRSNNMNENSIVFTVDEGYFISVTVSDVEMSNGNYLLIEAGDSHSDDSTDGRVFANTVKGPLTYLFKTSKVYAFCENTVGDEENPVTAEFTITFEQTGELTTTVAVTTVTAITVPPTEASDSVYIKVNVSGKPLEEYDNISVREAFQKCVATIATNYCKDNSIILTKDITEDYVMISEISRCPYRWENSETCVAITFRLPIFYDGSTEDYKLTTNELKMMWLRWEELDEQCFANNGFSVFDEPDVNQAIVWWAVGISLTTICFIILLWFLKTFGDRVKSVIRRRNLDRQSDTQSILSRNSVDSLAPHYYQGAPKLFEN